MRDVADESFALPFRASASAMYVVIAQKVMWTVKLISFKSRMRQSDHGYNKLLNYAIDR